MASPAGPSPASPLDEYAKQSDYISMQAVYKDKEQLYTQDLEQFSTKKMGASLDLDESGKLVERTGFKAFIVWCKTWSNSFIQKRQEAAKAFIAIAGKDIKWSRNEKSINGKLTELSLRVGLVDDKGNVLTRALIDEVTARIQTYAKQILNKEAPASPAALTLSPSNVAPNPPDHTDQPQGATPAVATLPPPGSLISKLFNKVADSNEATARFARTLGVENAHWRLVESPPPHGRPQLQLIFPNVVDRNRQQRLLQDQFRALGIVEKVLEDPWQKGSFAHAGTQYHTLTLSSHETFRLLGFSKKTEEDEFHAMMKHLASLGDGVQTKPLTSDKPQNDVSPKKVTVGESGAGAAGQQAVTQVGQTALVAVGAIHQPAQVRMGAPIKLSEMQRNDDYSVAETLKAFGETDSSALQTITEAGGRNFTTRGHFHAAGWNPPPPLIAASEFVPPKMVDHLMRNKKEIACGVKWEGLEGEQITNMEAAMHTFVTPVVQMHMTGNFDWRGHVVGKNFEGNRVRPLIMSAAIHPDFEKRGADEVVMRLVGLEKEPIKGKLLEASFAIPDANDKADPAKRAAYEAKLRAHMVHHLTQGKGLPSIAQVEAHPAKYTVMDQTAGTKFLEGLIIAKGSQDLSTELENKFMRVGGRIVSLEALYKIYQEQIRNEFNILEKALPQGYIYTIDPPVFFVGALGAKGSEVLNRLQILALKDYAKRKPFKSLREIGYNDFSDKGAEPLLRGLGLQSAGKAVKVQPKSNLFVEKDDVGPEYDATGREGWALVEHNNSDGFGDNITNEGFSSKDGLLGCVTDASRALRLDRQDLLSGVLAH